MCFGLFVDKMVRGPLSIVEVDCHGCTFAVVGAELGHHVKYHNSQTTAVSIYQTLFTTAPQSSIYIVDH